PAQAGAAQAQRRQGLNRQAVVLSDAPNNEATANQEQQALRPQGGDKQRFPGRYAVGRADAAQDGEAGPLVGALPRIGKTPQLRRPVLKPCNVPGPKVTGGTVRQGRIAAAQLG